MLVLTCPGPFAGAGSFVPTDLADLALWAKPESLSALAHNDPVAQWDDSSGNARHLVQATSGRRPLYQTSGGPNSVPCVLFDGVDDGVAAAFTIAVPVTLFIVVKNITWTSGDRVTEGYATSTMRIQQTGTSPGLRICGTTTTGITRTMPALGTWAAVKALWNGASSTAAYNDVADTTGSITTGTPTGISVAGVAASTGSAGNIAVSEVIAYTRALDSSEQTQVKSYLNTKYALW